MNFDITPYSLAALGGALVSILLMFLPLWPRYEAKWAALSDAQKQAVNVVATIVVTLGIILVSCFTDVVFIACSQVSISNLLFMLLTAIMGNAGTYVTFGKSGTAMVAASKK